LAASPCPAHRGRAHPAAAGVARGAPFGDRGRMALVPGDDMDLVDLDLAVEDHRRGLGGKPLPQMLGHRLHVRGAKVQLLRDLPVREVEAHEVQAEHPDPQRLVGPGQRGAGQVVEAGAAPRAAMALAVRLAIVPAVAGDRSALAVRTADAVGPAMLAHHRVALCIVDQRGEVNQARRGHAWHRRLRKDPSSTDHPACGHPPSDHPETRQEPRPFEFGLWWHPSPAHPFVYRSGSRAVGDVRPSGTGGAEG
jgi:hypothetical protein